MGHPKKLRKKYETPKKPYDKERLNEEIKLVKDYGLKNKHELWRAESMLRNFRRIARELQGSKDEKKENELIKKLVKIGLVAPKSTLDDILELKEADLLERRLQTIVFKRGLARTIKAARQLITHGHISINKRKVWWPSYTVPVLEETKIVLDPNMNVAPSAKDASKENKEKNNNSKEGENGEEKK